MFPFCLLPVCVQVPFGGYPILGPPAIFNKVRPPDHLRSGAPPSSRALGFQGGPGAGALMGRPGRSSSEPRRCPRVFQPFGGACTKPPRAVCTNQGKPPTTCREVSSDGGRPKGVVTCRSTRKAADICCRRPRDLRYAELQASRAQWAQTCAMKRIRQGTSKRSNLDSEPSQKAGLADNRRLPNFATWLCLKIGTPPQKKWSPFRFPAQPSKRDTQKGGKKQQLQNHPRRIAFFNQTCAKPSKKAIRT